MEIRIRDTGQVVSDREFIAMNANSSLPGGVLTSSFIEEHGGDAVLEAPAPAITQYQSALRNGVVQDALGNWVYAWIVRDWSAEEISAALDQIRNNQWELIKAKRELLSDTAGYKVSVAGVDKWFHSDPKSKTQQLANKDTARDQLAAGGTMTDSILDEETGQTIAWKTMDGTFVVMTCQLAFDVVRAAKGADFAIFKAAEVHNATMRQVADPSTYDFSGGWPEAYPG